jgi:hypothetical protein
VKRAGFDGAAAQVLRGPGQMLIVAAEMAILRRVCGQRQTPCAEPAEIAFRVAHGPNQSFLGRKNRQQRDPQPKKDDAEHRERRHKIAHRIKRKTRESEDEDSYGRYDSTSIILFHEADCDANSKECM